MTCWQELYGCDVDGNRGIWVWDYELDEEDEEFITEKLYEKLINDELKEKEEISLYCDRIDDYFDIEVDPSDYIDLIEEMWNNEDKSVFDECEIKEIEEQIKLLKGK